MDPRWYQSEAIDAVIDAWIGDSPAPCLALPTGAGKSLTAAMLAARMRADLDTRTMMVADRLALLPQLAAACRSVGLSVEVVQAPSWSTPPPAVMDADVLVGSAQTVETRGWGPDDLSRADDPLGVLIVDECHVERGMTRRWLDEGQRTGRKAVGLTATPLARWMHRGDPPGPWTSLISPVTTSTLIEQDYLLAPVFRAEIPDVTDAVDPLTGTRWRRTGEDWSGSEAEAIMSPHTRATAACWRALCDAPVADGGYGGEQPPTLVTAATIDHACALAEAFGAAAGAGRRWCALTAGEDAAETRRILDDYRAGAVDGICAVHKITIGVDAPDATIAVAARPTRKLLTWIQFIGRIMRRPISPRGVERVTVLDAGTGNAERFAGALHRFWSAGAQWPFPAAPAAGSGLGPGQVDPPAARTCPDHPTVVQSPTAQVCAVCFRPMAEPEPVESTPSRRRWRGDVVSLRDVATTVLSMARDRAMVPPLATAEHRSRQWARGQIHSLCGRWPRPDWPSSGWLDADGDPPHPVVRRVVKRNARVWREWCESGREGPSPTPERVKVS